MRVEVLFFDGCPNHPPTVELVRDVAEALGLDVEIGEVEVRDQAEAETLRFLGSPSIRVDGVDVEPVSRTRTDYAFACRTYRGAGLPPREMLVDAMTGNGGISTAAGRDENRTTGMVAVGGSVLSAVAASACCWIPLLLIAFGVSAGGVSAWFEQYRLLFLGVTVVLLGTAFYVVYFRKPVCTSDSACPRDPRLHRFSRVMLWVATVFVVAIAAFPKYVGALIPESTPVQAAIPVERTTTAVIAIDGMTCEGCAVLVQNSLVKVPGVLGASVSYADGTATLDVDSASPPSREALAAALEGAGYKILDDHERP